MCLAQCKYGRSTAGGRCICIQNCGIAFPVAFQNHGSTKWSLSLVLKTPISSTPFSEAALGLPHTPRLGPHPHIKGYKHLQEMAFLGMSLSLLLTLTFPTLNHCMTLEEACSAPYPSEVNPTDGAVPYFCSTVKLGAVWSGSEQL